MKGTGSELRGLRKARGLQASFVAERAGFTAQHFSKIERKKDLSVDEFVRFTKAMDLLPGDLLENSLGDMAPLLPLVEKLKRFNSSQLAGVADALDLLASFAASSTEAPTAVPHENPPIPDNVHAMPERTSAHWTLEFPIDPKDFNDNGDTDYPLELHVYEMEDIEAAAGVVGLDNGDMATPVLSSKEVREGKIRTVRVRGSSMAPTFEEGWKLAVDVTKQDPARVSQEEPVIVYRKDEGMMLGRWRRDGKRVLLGKDNEQFQPVELQPGDKLIGVVAYVAWSPVAKKKRSVS